MKYEVVVQVNFTRKNIYSTINGDNMICQAATNVVSTGKNMLFCAGLSDGDNTKLYNLILVSQ
jgi:hypothetical protein